RLRTTGGRLLLDELRGLEADAPDQREASAERVSGIRRGLEELSRRRMVEVEGADSAHPARQRAEAGRADRGVGQVIRRAWKRDTPGIVSEVGVAIGHGAGSPLNWSGSD